MKTAITIGACNIAFYICVIVFLLQSKKSNAFDHIAIIKSHASWRFCAVSMVLFGAVVFLDIVLNGNVTVSKLICGSFLVTVGSFVTAISSFERVIIYDCEIKVYRFARKTKNYDYSVVSVSLLANASLIKLHTPTGNMLFFSDARGVATLMRKVRLSHK